MSEHGKADYEYQNTVATVISVARRAKTIFDNSSEPARKRQFLNMILQNPTVNEKKLYFTIASPFNLVLDFANSPTWLDMMAPIGTFWKLDPLAAYLPNLKDELYPVVRSTMEELLVNLRN